MTPTIDSIRWAVALGCTTPKRYAHEKGININMAATLLEWAAGLKQINRVEGGYTCKPMEMSE